MTQGSPHFVDRLVARSLRGGIPVFVFLLSLVAGGLALMYTPRAEEPQIVVPMLEVLVSAPGLSADQVARQVTIPVEKLLSEIPGIEHIYSASNNGKAAVTLRFYVGEDREESILNTYNLGKLMVNVIDGLPVYLQDVATIIDGPGETGAGA